MPTVRKWLDCYVNSNPTVFRFFQLYRGEEILQNEKKKVDHQGNIINIWELTNSPENGGFYCQIKKSCKAWNIISSLQILQIPSNNSFSHCKCAQFLQPMSGPVSVPVDLGWPLLSFVSHKWYEHNSSFQVKLLTDLAFSYLLPLLPWGSSSLQE